MRLVKIHLSAPRKAFDAFTVLDDSPRIEAHPRTIEGPVGVNIILGVQQNAKNECMASHRIELSISEAVKLRGDLAAALAKLASGQGLTAVK